MEKLLIILIFQLELKKYLIGNELVFHRSNTVKRLECNGFIAIVLYAIFNICVPQNVLVNMIVVHGVIIVITWFAICTPNAHGKVLSVICLAVIEYCINKSFYPILSLFEQQLQDLPGATYWYLLLESLWGMFVVVVLGGIVRKKRRKKKDILSPNTITYLLVFVIAQMVGNIIAVRFTSQYIVHVELQKITELLATASCINVCFLLWMLMYFRRQREVAEEELTLSEELRETEISYYQALLEKEENTRRFRHDVKNHIFCLNELVSRGEQEKAKEYIQNISEEFSEITKRKFHTQNDMFDAILHDKLKKLDDDVEISLHGCFTEPERMELYDFCLVFSNLLNNAVEELSKVREAGGKTFLEIQIKCTREFSEVKIINSVIGKKRLIRYGLPVTEKSDKRNHGFGLKKVQQTLEKYQGDVTLKSTEDFFEVTVRY